MHPDHAQLLNTRFSPSFYKQMINAEAVVPCDMATDDPDLARGLQWLLHNDISDADLGLTFSAERNSFGHVETVDLIPDGQAIPVTEVWSTLPPQGCILSSLLANGPNHHRMDILTFPDWSWLHADAVT